jgi:hypothetical protein
MTIKRRILQPGITANRSPTPKLCSPWTYLGKVVMTIQASLERITPRASQRRTSRKKKMTNQKAKIHLTEKPDRNFKKL